MADIFQEVQEDLRRDRLKSLWDKYGSAIILVAAAIVLAVGGWRAYQYYEAREAAAAGDRYQAAAALAESGKSEEARKAFGAIAADGPPGYRALARLREADETVKTDKVEAVKLYLAVAEDQAADGSLKDAARVRGAYAAVDGGSRDDVKRFAEPLATSNGAWSSLANETLGLAAFKVNAMDDARRHFEAIVDDPEAPGASRQRANLMLDVLPPPAPKAPATESPKEAPKPN